METTQTFAPQTLTPNGDVEREIRAFLVETFLYGRNSELCGDTPLLDTVIDSHGVVELVVFLQDQFGIVVNDEEVITDNLNSLDRLVAFVQRKLAASR
jgi:acyl carrier protein